MNKCIILFLLTLFNQSSARFVDTSSLFWNNFLYVDYSYGVSYLTLTKINKDYIDAFAKPWLFNNNPHWSTVKFPSIGIPFGNSIATVGFYWLHMKYKGEITTINSINYQNYFYMDYYSFEAEYRKCYKINKYLLLNPGLCAFYGKGYTFVGTQGHYDDNKSDGNLKNALGGGGGFFIEGLFKYHSLILGPRIGINIGMTNTLKSKYEQEWIVSTNNKKINLDLSGFYILLKTGFLL